MQDIDLYAFCIVAEVNAQAAAESIISQLSEQSESFHTWAMTIVGAVVAMNLAVIRHNYQKDAQQIRLYSTWLIPIILVMQAFSLLLGRIFVDALLSMTPLFFGATYTKDEVFNACSVKGATGLQVVLWLQFIFMFLGVVLLATFGGLNFWRLVTKKQRKEN